MFRGITKSKFLIVFISAFLCLNLSGSLCLAYCQAKTSAAETEHCPIAKAKRINCPNSTGEDVSGTVSAHHFSGDEIDCCIPPINFFAAPLEKNQTTFQTTEAAKNFAANASFSVSAIADKRRSYPARFHLKPPLDRRVERVKNGVFRI